MKKKLQLITCILFSAALFSQSTLTGVVHYESNYSQQTIDNYFSNRRETVKNKKNKQLYDKIYLNTKRINSTLRFNLNEALFELDKKISIKDRGNLAEKLSSITAGGIHKYYQNANTKTLEIQNCETLGECFIIVSTFKKWQLSQETKKIAGYLCYKATTVVTRNKKKSNITAWYCPQIPVSFGPKEYNGLPGIILELDNSHIYFRATKLILNPKEKVLIKKPTKGKRVSQKEYSRMSKEAWSKM
jgi:GLPGLI family protein